MGKLESTEEETIEQLGPSTPLETTSTVGIVGLTKGMPGTDDNLEALLGANESK